MSGASVLIITKFLSCVNSLCTDGQSMLLFPLCMYIPSLRRARQTDRQCLFPPWRGRGRGGEGRGGEGRGGERDDDDYDAQCCYDLRNRCLACVCVRIAKPVSLAGESPVGDGIVPYLSRTHM